MGLKKDLERINKEIGDTEERLQNVKNDNILEEYFKQAFINAYTRYLHYCQQQKANIVSKIGRRSNDAI